MRSLLTSLRRAACLLGGAGLLVAAAPASQAEPPTAMDAAGNMVIGDPSAPVLIDEYASVGCPHCAKWAEANWPGLKARFIDTGRARFVLHEMITGDGSLAAAGFLIARCAGPAHYFDVVDQVYRRQLDLEREGGAILFTIAKDAGLTPEKASACLNDEAALKRLEQRTQADASARKVDSTPTFFVDGKRLAETPSLDTLAADIDARSSPAAHAHE